MTAVHVIATSAARRVVDRARRDRAGTLTITIGTGCCESTAPFLYEDFWPGVDQEPVGDVDGVIVYAPGYLRALYPDGDGVVIDAIEIDAESLSIETEWGMRLILRGHGVDTGVEACEVPSAPPTLDLDDPDRPGARVRGDLPEVLTRAMRLR